MRTRLVIVLIAIVECMPGIAVGQRPPNDNCENRIVVSVGTTSWTTVFADSDGSSVSCRNAGREIYFEFTPAVSGLHSIDLCGSAFDTVLTVLTGCGGTEIACNDDACGTQSSVGALPLTAGTPYVIRVAGFEGDAGPGVLNIGAPCPEDLDGDGVVGLSDLAILLSHFGAAGGPSDGDLDGDAIVGLSDLALLLSAFGSTC